MSKESVAPIGHRPSAFYIPTDWENVPSPALPGMPIIHFPVERFLTLIVDGQKRLFKTIQRNFERLQEEAKESHRMQAKESQKRRIWEAWMRARQFSSI